jgi:hypothetical protein
MIIFLLSYSSMILMSYSILSPIIIIYLYNFYNIFDISLVYYNIQIIFHNVSFFIYEIINVFKNDDYKHLCLSEKIISSIFVSIYIIIYISLKSTIILIDLALYSYCSLFIVLPIKTLIFILKRINKLIRDFILNHDEDNNEYVYRYENIITDTLHSYIIIVIIIINSIISIINIIYTILSIITNGIIRITNGIIRITNGIIRINKIIEQNKKLLYINENQNKIINDLETLHYSPKLLEIRNNIINELKKELEEKNKCSICFNNTISHCCNPCGHTYCTDCINKTNNCYICRGIIRNKIKLYL